MLKRRQLAALAALPLATPAFAQSQYPDRPIRVIVPFPAGGATDIWARLVTEPMAADLGQPIVIDNRGGAGAMIGTEAVARAAPDGYTLLFTISSSFQSPVVLRRDPYRLSDFAPIGKMGTTSLVFCVGANQPPRSMEEFISFARGKSLNYGTYSPGSTGHAMAQLLSDTHRLDMSPVHYRGEAPLLADVLGGRIPCAFHSMTGAGEHIRAGRIRPLAVLGRDRIPSLPQIPTLIELGMMEDFAQTGFLGMLGPARLPQPIHARLAESYRKAMARPEVVNRLREMDTIPQWLGPEEFRADMEQYLRWWTALVDRMGLRADG
ncbi:tripartite tricarboxylate transporter substrate binding protein [Sabulicella glaciei]|uniref:Tripartite tricarboxylate transporter substrate binding protein n=1 Tax=Sabulicella glaciei TaxID=2984948 RepID=A0ABT3NUQ0_9PROT|nr:tripartite tricarboxylate transporter substrate binding protein [Roseococcus sp. MDT2-1-1]MCW8085887.1 tripartite tricarboxylate transporter substrate binding protein [Roseococcus sp. MDT2-1-1]